MKGRLVLSALLAAALIPGVAKAGGYDTPIVYTARHIGMGGTAIGYVNDPSALYHNPAGMAHNDLLTVTLDFSPLIGRLTTSPAENEQNIESDLTFAPFFLGGVTYNPVEWLSVGVGVYPVASSGAGYTYTNSAGVSIEDRTRIAFIEVTPGVAVSLPWNLKIGASWRATILQFRRLQRNADDKTVPAVYDMDMVGASYAGFRVGVQWQPLEWLQVGAVFRSKTETTVEADEATLVGLEAGKTDMTFTLPAKVGVGARADLGPFAAAADFEWGFYSQNTMTNIEGELPGQTLKVPLYYKWQDAPTVRVGFEYEFLPFMYSRIGYVFDGKTSNIYYPNAFGTPPGETHSLTAGVGARFGWVEVNLAYAYRFGSATVPELTAEEKDAKGIQTCLACSKAGDYGISLHGIYIDTSLYF